MDGRLVEHGKCLRLVMALLNLMRVGEFEVMHTADGDHQNDEMLEMLENGHGQHWGVGKFVAQIIVY